MQFMQFYHGWLKLFIRSGLNLIYQGWVSLKIWVYLTCFMCLGMTKSIGPAYLIAVKDRPIYQVYSAHVK